VAYRLTGAGRAETLIGRITVNRWMPGKVADLTEQTLSSPDWALPRGPVVEVRDQVTVPADLPPGTYRLAVGIVGTDSADAVVRLGIKGRDADGWYPLSNLEIGQ